MSTSLAAQPSTPLVIAHRAGNHLHLLRDAEALGVGLVEADVHLHRGRLEVRHLKTAGPLPVLWDTWKLANPFAPRLQLEQLLEDIGDSTPLMLDLKGRNTDLSPRVLRAVRSQERAGATVVCARAWKLLDPVLAEPDIDAVYSVGNQRQLDRLRRQTADRVLDGVSIHERLLCRASAADLLDRCRLVMTWPVNSIERARTLVDWGVRGLITDRPDLLVPALTPQLEAASA